MAHLEYTPRSNSQNQIKSVASSASDRNSNQFQSTLILWFKCNKTSHPNHFNHVHVQNWKPYNYYAHFNFAHSSISINLHITCQFFIIIKSTTRHFIFSLRELGIWGIIFFPFPFPPFSPHCQQSPCLLCRPLSPVRLLFFLNIIAIFYWNSQWEPLQRREHQKPTILNYLTLQKKQHQKLLKTITYYFMHKLTKLTILLL